MLDNTVQSKADGHVESADGKKDSMAVQPGELDTSTEGIVRICGLITEMTIKAKRERWPGW